MIKVVAKSFAKPDKLDRILELSEELVEKTVVEEGCIKYELFQDMRDPKVMIIIEEWESEEALNKHMASEHFKRIVPQLNELREKASEVNILKKLF
ncbi:MAG TPA: putative quinol monooxygenase [Bacillota bacterium]|jgi:quinol monooxygenase YgiN|nr:putative quinol monooxygenase [Bacillota bacterium]HRS20641.1 putative quinol monooxygenase [Clostridia bacterium]HRU42041.1 putative quinol monooxygenase [Candidatus Diapherotrites archaeon]HQE66354.1 putative quinol monooxygenase [Bacillota bacterium]HQI15780.1 putative quinol monooxygenase [Bacillota bacterium]